MKRALRQAHTFDHIRGEGEAGTGDCLRSKLRWEGEPIGAQKAKEKGAHFLGAPLLCLELKMTTLYFI